MNSLFTWLIIGVVIYLLFFRGGGIGCCGGHRDHDGRHADHDHGSGTHPNPEVHTQKPDQIIDLNKDQYKVVAEAKKSGATDHDRLNTEQDPITL